MYLGGKIQLGMAVGGVVGVVMIAGEMITIVGEMIKTAEGMTVIADVTTTTVIETMIVEMVATASSSKPMVKITRMKGMTPQMIAPWLHTREPSPRMLTFVRRRDEVDRLEEALVEVRMDERDELRLGRASKRAETGISHG